VRGEGALRRRVADLETYDVKTTNHRPRSLTRGLVAGGLLVTLALPALAGTAHATERSTRPTRAATPEPTAEPTRAATPEPTAPVGGTPTEAPSDARPTAAPTPVPSQAPTTAPGGSTDEDELAHTGSSTTTAVMGAGAAVLIAGGGGALYAVRRRQTR
jgi:LPXTG-motif cell wall-anchored protein